METSPKPRGAIPKQTGAVETSQSTSGQSDFEKFVREGIADIRSMLTGLETAIEFQATRTSNLETRVTPLETKVKAMEITFLEHTRLLAKSTEAENKLERFSRKNNFRIVGLPFTPREDPMVVARNFLTDHFQLDSPKIERAHRDGPQKEQLPRHFLVKMLSFQDKRSILSQQRKKLENTNIYIIDDLTKTDRENAITFLEVNGATRMALWRHFTRSLGKLFIVLLTCLICGVLIMALVLLWC